MMFAKPSFRHHVLMLATALLGSFVCGLLLIRPGNPQWEGWAAVTIPFLLFFTILHAGYWGVKCFDQSELPHGAASAPPIIPAGELPKPMFRQLRRDLDSYDEENRRHAIQGFADSGISPVAGIRCWPEQLCTDLQLAAAEAMLREWLEYLKDHPGASEPELVNELFPLEELDVDEDQIGPRVRRLTQPKLPPPSRLEMKLDQWSEKVKETMLDWDISVESNDLGGEGEDCLLLPLDREQFAERMRGKVAEVMEHVTGALASARSDYDLVCAEKDIHPLLSTLRWEAVVAALELRQPGGEPVSIDEVRELAGSLSPADGDSKGRSGPTGDWVSKYRRMRAGGF